MGCIRNNFHVVAVSRVKSQAIVTIFYKVKKNIFITNYPIYHIVENTYFLQFLKNYGEREL